MVRPTKTLASVMLGALLLSGAGSAVAASQSVRLQSLASPNGVLVGSSPDMTPQQGYASAGGAAPTKLPFYTFGPFSPDGASMLASVDETGMVVRHAVGTEVKYRVPAAGVLVWRGWVPDGSVALAVYKSPAAGGASSYKLWQLTSSAPAAEMSNLFTGSFPDEQPAFAYDPQSPTLTFQVPQADGSTTLESVDTSGVGALPVMILKSFCPGGVCSGDSLLHLLAASATGQGLLVEYSAHPTVGGVPVPGPCDPVGCVGWMSPDGGSFTKIFNRLDIGYQDLAPADGAVLSPDAGVMAVANNQGTTTLVSTGGTVLVTLPLTLSPRSSWQPCPGGTCAHFVAKVPPAPIVDNRHSGPTFGHKLSIAYATKVASLDRYVRTQFWAAKLDSSGHTVSRTILTTMDGTTSKGALLRLTANRRYKVRVRVTTAGGTGLWSAFSKIMTNH